MTGMQRSAGLLGLFLLIACGSSDSSSNCPSDLPASCPSPAPSYQSTIAPLIYELCVPCHSPGGQEASRPFLTYNEVFAQRTEILSQVYTCTMPLRGSQQPSPQERAQLLAWLVCGAPNN